MSGVVARELCTLSLRTRYRGTVVFSVHCLHRLHLQRIYVLASREVLGTRCTRFAVRHSMPVAQIIASAAFLASCWVATEEASDRRFLAQVGAESAPARLGRPQHGVGDGGGGLRSQGLA